MACAIENFSLAPQTRIANMQIDQARLDELKQFNQCNICERVLCRPVFFPCGHSPVCQQCAIVKKPKSCPRCGEPNKGPCTKLKVNLSLASLIRALWPAEFGLRPNDDALLHELQRKEATDRLDKAIARTMDTGTYYARLPPDYRDNALKLIQLEYAEDGKHIGTHVLRWCQCDLLELPKRSKKGTYFFGCPAWQPLGCKRKRVTEEGNAEDMNEELILASTLKYCPDFAFLSKKQKEIILPIYPC